MHDCQASAPSLHFAVTKSPLSSHSCLIHFRHLRVMFSAMITFSSITLQCCMWLVSISDASIKLTIRTNCDMWCRQEMNTHLHFSTTSYCCKSYTQFGKFNMSRSSVTFQKTEMDTCNLYFIALYGVEMFVSCMAFSFWWMPKPQVFSCAIY